VSLLLGRDRDQLKESPAPLTGGGVFFCLFISS